MRLLLDPVLERAGDGLGPLKPAVEIGIGHRAQHRGRRRRSATSGQRVLGQYELVLLDEAVEDRPPRLLFVLPNLGQAVRGVRRRRGASS